MMKKLLFAFLIIFSSFISEAQQIIITSTSVSSSWSPRSVTNTGNDLVWEASNGLIGTLTQTANVPNFDFSANDGSPINITVSSSDSFVGLTRFQVYTLDITSIDASPATQLDNYHVQNNAISAIDISALTNLTFFRTLDNTISSLDISNNPLLDRLEVNNNSLSSTNLDALVNQLDTFGLLDGILNLAGNQGLTLASQPAYDNLIAKGWLIDVPAPGPPVIATMTITTTSTSAVWSPRSVTNTGNAFLWEASNALIGTLTQTSSNPTFDFSANDGTPINITVTSNDGFSGLTRFQVYTLDISNIDASQATQLDNYHVQNNAISAIDISTLTNVTFFRALDNTISTLDISNNASLTRLEVNNNSLSSTDLDAIVNQLDTFGLLDGILNISGNQGLTLAAQPAYDNLIAKGWLIDVPAPGPPVIATMTITTTSTSASWSPRSVTNTGNAFQWEATNALIGTLTQTANIPSFDFSANDGTPINITVTSNDDFTGLTRFQVYTLDITDIDASQATQLDNYHVQNNAISAIDISTLANVTFFRALDNTISTLDISNNPLLTRLEVNNNSLSSTDLDAMVNQLDTFGLLDGILNISGNQGLTTAAQPAYDNLIAKGWLIDVPAPGPPVIATMTITTTSTSAAWSPRSVTNTGNAFQWEATNALIGTLTQTANIPSFDFSANDGTPINITVTSNDGFTGLSRFQVFTLDITDIDATQATQLDNYHVQNNAISAIDISTLTNVTFFRALDNTISTLDISNNSLLTRLEVNNNSLSSTDLDAIVNQLDAFGLSDGLLNISGNQGLTTAAQPAYDNLIAKGWIIDVPAPGPPVTAVISITTTSTSASWSPRSVTNTGNAFVWEATNALIGTLTQTANVPSFDFSSNDGTPISITVTSNDGFTGLTRFQVYTLDITDVDATQATQLDNYHAQNNALSAIDISTLTNVTFFRAFDNTISALDVSNNALLTRLEVNNNNLSSTDLDAIVNQLDIFGLLDGILSISGNQGLTNAAQPAYDNLIAKGWLIDVPPPGPPVIATISIVTTSTSATWSPQSVTNTGNALEWEATNAVIGTITQSGNNPSFDFSGNDGTPINITVTSNDGFVGLTRFQMFTLDITTIDATQATQLDNYHVQNNAISAIDISTLTNLTFFRALDNSIITLDISNNPLMIRLEMDNNSLSSAELDAIVNQLDAFGLLDGILNISGNQGLTLAAQPAYDNLIAKGWIIDVPAPGPPVTATISITTTSTSSSWSARSVTNSGNAFEWEATNAAIGTITQTGNSPAFDFSGNDGSPINITVTSNDGFSGLTLFQVFTLDISSIDATQATQLDNYHVQNNAIPSIDISTLTNITFFRANQNTISTLDISNNPLLTRLELTDNSLSSTELDAIVNQLDTFGLLDGILTLANNTGGLTLAAQPAYDNLIAKGWTIDIGPPAPGAIIDVLGNGISIANGDTTPDIADDTDFSLVTNNTAKTNTFTITNNGTLDLNVTDIKFSFGSSAAFTFDNLPAFPATVAPGANITFNVVFIPPATGNYSAFVEIDNSDTNQNPFQYAIAGEGADIVVSGDIMITQYYNNTTGDNWIEVKNISGGTIPAGTYFLALYDQNAIPNISGQAPNASQSIPILNANDVILFNNNAVLPGPLNLGSVPIIPTAVCNFDGNDVILISTTNDATCYGNRQDIVGDIPAQTWGSEISLIRGGSSSETPEPFFDISKWILLSPAADVDVASTSTNIALGIQGVGPTVWNGSTWDNLDPDKTRTVEISGTYNASSGNINAYNLIVNAGGTLNFDSGTVNSVIIDGNLTIDGTFVIGDQESLVMTNDIAVTTGNITKIENSTPRNNTHDFTYWSSPIAAGSIGTAFAGVTPSRIFLFDASLQISDPNDPNYFAPWVVASGLMTPGRGYAAEGVTGTTGIHNLSYTGEPNNGLITFDIFENNDSDPQNDYNLIGNPYPSAIDIEIFLTVNNALIDPTVYLWTHNSPISGGDSGDFISSDYATYNFTGGTGTGSNPNDPGKIPTKNIGSSQGFFVRAISSGLVTFNNNMRMADANDQFFKTNNSKSNTIVNGKDRIWLNLSSDKGADNQILIGFTEMATEDVDSGYDALKFIGANNNPLYFYSVIQDKKYVIQGLNTFSIDKSVALGFDMNVAPRNLTISINKTEGSLIDSEVFLVDHLLNITHNLKAADYQFEQSTTGENLDRFTLQFVENRTVLGINGELSNNEFSVSREDENLKIRSNKNVSEIKVYDMLGRIIINKKPDKNSFYLNTSKVKNGTVLIIEARLDNGTIVNKKTIKY